MRPGWFCPLLLALACNESPPDRREWRPSDHDHTDSPSENQVAGGPDGGSPELARHGLNEVTMIAWQQNCVRCHGRLGSGDGPQGPMTRATDLGNPDFQRTITDEQMLKSIRDGKGLMPAFPLPEPTLKSLVQLVRLIGKASADAEAGATAAPSGSVAPHGSVRVAPHGSVRVAPHGSVRVAPSARPGASGPRAPQAAPARTVTSAAPPVAAPAPSP